MNNVTDKCTSDECYYTFPVQPLSYSALDPAPHLQNDTTLHNLLRLRKISQPSCLTSARSYHALAKHPYLWNSSSSLPSCPKS